MSILIRYSPMASYLQLSIIFLTLQIIQHTPCQHNLPWHLRDHHRLYPIPIAPSARHHVVDFPYDLWTMLFYFPFWFLFYYLMHPVITQPITSHRTVWSGPYHLFNCTWTLCLFYLSFVFKTLVSTPEKKGSFSPEFRLKFIPPYHFTSLCLTPSPYFALPTHFALSHHPEPSFHTILHSLVPHQETIHCSWITPLRAI